MSEKEDTFSNDVLCMIIEYSCYKGEKTLIQALHKRFTQISEDEQANLRYYSSAKKRFLIVGLEGYLCDSENPDIAEAIGSFEELSRESYDHAYDTEEFPKVYKALKVQSLLHFVRKGNFDSENLKSLLKKLTVPIKLPKMLPSKNKSTDTYIETINQVEKDNKQLVKRFDEFFNDQKNRNKAKVKESVQKILKEFPYDQFKEQIRSFLRNLSNNIPLPILEMIDRGHPIGFTNEVKIEATSLSNVIDKEELQSIHRGSDHHLKKWIADHNMSEKLVFIKPKQSSYISYIQQVKSTEEETKKVPERAIKIAQKQDAAQKQVPQKKTAEKPQEKPKEIVKEKVPEKKKAAAKGPIIHEEETSIGYMMDDDDFDDQIQTQQKSSPPKRKFTPTNVAPAKKQKVGNVPNSIIPEEESDEEDTGKTRKKASEIAEAKRAKKGDTTSEPVKKPNPPKSSTSPGQTRIGVTLTGQRRRRKWSDDEVDLLMEGVRLFGTGNWASILNAFDFGDRTSVDLKDKFRNLRKKYTLEELLGVGVENADQSVNEENNESIED